MAGLINVEDIAEVRAKTRVDDVVAEHVALRRAGMGAFKGLCPFHDEKTPSFTVRPALGVWHCFGCGEGGDVISFVQKIDNLSFTDAVQHLADRCGVHLRMDGTKADAEAPNRRRRAMDAHTMATEFYRSHLRAPEARAARDFLRGKGFNGGAADQFGIGYAPNSWQELRNHLRDKGFTDDELATAGLLSTNEKGRHYDRFRGRVIWPIRDVTGATVGFGARKLYDDDKGPKYLNTPETPIYRKSNILYGLDMAKKAIGQHRRAVVVEGYTDVMACHLAGEETAVATCGTAFGAEHAKTISRMLTTGRMLKGKIIFTFDADAAGRKAALRTFDLGDQFTTSAYVASGPEGMDPCDIRYERGPEALLELFDSIQPLRRFVIESRVAEWDVNTIEGRVQALRDVAGIVRAIENSAERSAYSAQVAAMLGFTEEDVAAAVAAADPEQPRQTPVAKAARRGDDPGLPTAFTDEPPPPDYGDEVGPPEGYVSDHGYPGEPGQPGGGHHQGGGHHDGQHIGGQHGSGPSNGGYSQGGQGHGGQTPGGHAGAGRSTPRAPQVSGVVLENERVTLAALVQHPYLGATDPTLQLEPEHFEAPNHQRLFEYIQAAGLQTGPQADNHWSEALIEVFPDDLYDAISWLASYPLHVKNDPQKIANYVNGMVMAVLISYMKRQRTALTQKLTAAGGGEESLAISRNLQDVTNQILALEANRV